MRLRLRRVLSILAETLLLIAVPVRAQDVSTLQGGVTDTSGAVVPDAKIEITEASSRATRDTTTDTNGSFAFNQLRPGTYSVQVSKTGFKLFLRENVVLLVATPTTIAIRLEVGSLSEQVAVAGESEPTVNTTDATIGNPFDERDVKSLPFLARNAASMLTLQPGVITTGESDTDKLSMGSISALDSSGRDGAVNGVRGNQTNLTIDGVDANDWQNQAAFTSALPVTLDSLEEFRVTTTNANASEGVAGGAQVALVTKSGSNDFHGNLRWFYRTSGTAANSFFANASGLPRPKLQRNIGGGSLGGRLVRDRAFFFLDYEARREESSQPELRSIPSESLKDGALIYECAEGANCPGGTVQGLTASHPVPPGAFGMTPAMIKVVDPAGLGIDPAMISYLKQFPAGNDPAAGADNGLNFTAYRFNAPIGTDNNIYTARFDFNLTRDGRHAIFWRGILGGIKTDLQGAQFPGLPPADTLLNNSRGFVLSYSGQWFSNVTDTLRWGFTRMGVTESGNTGASFGSTGFDTLTNYNRGFGRIVPVNEIKDDLSWSHGTHLVQFGGAVRFVRNHHYDQSNSYPFFSIESGICQSLCNQAALLLLSTGAPPLLDQTIFTRSVMTLLGSISFAGGTFQADPKTGTFFPQGTTARRIFAENDFETYAQDSWRLRSNITFTYGLRYGYETPPWEVNGLQVRPDQDLNQWFFDRVAQGNAGIGSNVSPLLSWVLAGRANNAPSWYSPDYRNFAPRLAMAWSPGFDAGPGKVVFGGPGKSSVRVGAGIYYDREGGAIAAENDSSGSPGLATSEQNSSGLFNLATAPRFAGSCSSAGCTGLPSLNLYVTPPTKVQFPFAPAANTSNVDFAVDNRLRTPYSMNFDLSIQRELPGKVTLDVGYVGTLGRRLLAKIDFGMYENLRDPKSGATLFQAYDQIAKLVGPNPFKPSIDPTSISALSNIANIPYFQNLMPNMPAFTASFLNNPAYASLTPTQAFYAFVTQAGAPSWSCALFFLDTLGIQPSPWNSSLDPHGTGFVLYTPQFSTLDGWTNFASSNYNSLQISVRKNVGGSVFTANYVYSKSIDNASAAENGDFNPNLGSGAFNGLNGLIENPYDLRASRADSNFDLRHNFNATFVSDLPFGTGKRFAGHASRKLNALVGGWEISGAWRWRSGFPISPDNGFFFPTDFFLETFATFTAPVHTHVVRNGANGVPNLFSDPAAIFNDTAFTLPGGTGSRNAIYGPAYFDVDLGVYKTFRVPWSERQRLQFRATAYNTFNDVNFSDNVLNMSMEPDQLSTFGQVTATAGPRGGAREMEFAVRFDF